MNGTTISDTFAILLIPPMTTSPTQSVRMMQVITVLQEYVRPNSDTAFAVSGSKKFVTADAILLTWVNVPMPKRPTHAPKNAKIFASHLQFFPIPFSM